MKPKFFSVDEADRLIGFYETTLQRIRRNKQLFLWLQEELSILKLIADSGAGEDNPDVRELEEKTRRYKMVAEEIDRDIRAINETGCLLRDIDRGIIDFYSTLDDEVVFLCWQEGEDSVMYWHSLNEGFRGRRPLVRPSTNKN